MTRPLDAPSSLATDSAVNALSTQPRREELGPRLAPGQGRGLERELIAYKLA